MRPSLKIAGLDISVIAWLDFNQRVTPLAGGSSRRLSNGSLLMMTRWQAKYRVTLSGSGWVPAPLLAIPTRSPFVIELPKAIAWPVGEALPPGWMPRAAPWAEFIHTDPAGQQTRMVYVQMTVATEEGATQEGDGSDASWELTCEEV